MTATNLARRLTQAAAVYRSRPDDQALVRLESLAREAAARIDRVGEGTVDHIILAGVLKSIVRDVPALEHTLQRHGWRWLP